MRLFDLLYDTQTVNEDLSDKDKVIELLRVKPCSVKELQAVTHYSSRSTFLSEILNPLLKEGIVYREGNPKSPMSLIKISNPSQHNKN